MRTPLMFTVSALLLSVACLGQTVSPLRDFGKIDMADLEMKQCDFEKDANAMVLFDKGDIYFDDHFNVIMDRHKRIKIFNDKGKDEANIKIHFYGASRAENITDVQVETINENNGKPEITKIDRKLIYTQNIDKYRSVITFTFPNVKAGSVIEYKYRLQNVANYNLPDWYFQGDIPVRYSEINTEIPDELVYRRQTRVHQEYLKNKTSGGSNTIGAGTDAAVVNTEIRSIALGNIPSLTDEPFMSSRIDNLESIFFQLTSIRPVGGFVRSLDSWAKVGGALEDDDDFGGQLKRKLLGEETIIAKAKTLKTEDEKIAYIFNEVKNRMKWNEDDDWYTIDGTSKAWEKQTGNSAEINLSIYHLLKQAGIKAYPMIVSTREHGKANMVYPFLYQFNRAVTYIPVDSTFHYILDATNKYNTYNQTPFELLNSYGLYISKEENTYDLLFIKNPESARRSIALHAEITPDGKMDGTADISETSYYKQSSVEAYKKDGEEKFKKQITQDNNNLTITALKMDEMDVDTLPLTQKVDFKLALTGSDNSYIYFSPNVLASLNSNPFLSENRATNIDFGFTKVFSITGTFKLPAGFKTDAMPKNITLVMPDNSIVFKRIIGEDNGEIQVRYIINHKKAVYYKEDYPQLRDFYKKMGEMLNEQVVLKKM